MSSRSQFLIILVRTPQDLKDAVDLFHAYASSLGFDLAFQDFDAEMVAMPGKYSPPHGELLLAKDAAGTAIGCVGLRPLPASGVCEMKRLYVAPAGRGMGIGKALALKIIEVAKQLGYSEMRLDTLPSMVAAQSMYRALGFANIEPYYRTPHEETQFLSLALPQFENSLPCEQAVSKPATWIYRR